MTRTSLRLLYVFVPCLLIVGDAHGEEPAGSADSEEVDTPGLDIDAEYAAATRRAERGDFARAIRGFKLVAEHAPGWADAHYNIAHLSELAESYSDCALHFRRFLYLSPDDNERDEIEERIGTCERRTPNSGVLEIAAVDPARARVSINGQTITIGAPGPLVLPSGSYLVTATTVDYDELAMTVEVRSGEETTVELTLTPTIYYGSLLLDGLPSGAVVRVNNDLEVSAPMSEPLRLVAERHYIEIHHAGFHPWRRYIELRRDEDMILQVELIDASVPLDDL